MGAFYLSNLALRTFDIFKKGINQKHVKVDLKKYI